MNRYDTRPHIGCGGNLTFDKEQTVWLIMNARQFGVAKVYTEESELQRVIRMLEHYGKKPIVRSVTKNLYKCDKCKDFVNVIGCPSWEDYVLQGKIRVDIKQYLKIKNDRKRGAVRL